jgi:hypothetical protein
MTTCRRTLGSLLALGAVAVGCGGSGGRVGGELARIRSGGTGQASHASPAARSKPEASPIRRQAC